MARQASKKPSKKTSAKPASKKPSKRSARSKKSKPESSEPRSGWERLFEVPLLGRIIPHLNAFPLNTDESDPRAIRGAARRLADGHAVLIFPEGGRSVDGRLQPFKPGAFRLAIPRGVPVLPVSIAGAWQAWPPHHRFPRPGRVTVTFHAPIDPKEVAPHESVRVRAQLLAERAFREVKSALSP